MDFGFSLTAHNLDGIPRLRSVSAPLAMQLRGFQTQRGAFCAVAILAWAIATTCDAQPKSPIWEPPPGFVEVSKIDPGIFIELRYATPHNIAGTAIYPRDFPC